MHMTKVRILVAVISLLIAANHPVMAQDHLLATIPNDNMKKSP